MTFCAPVTKANVDPPPALPQISGPALGTDFVCYKVKCPTRPGDQEVSDQFGIRTLRRMRTDLLCVPAVKGPPPTTTTITPTTTTTTLPFCDDSFPTCGGTCAPLPDHVCGPLSDGSQCLCVPTSGTCLISQAPACDGTCPSGTCQYVDGYCNCVPTTTTTLPTDCGATFPTCDGDCPSGSGCGSQPGGSECLCVPAVANCYISAAPACSGNCPPPLTCGEVTGLEPPQCACF